MPRFRDLSGLMFGGWTVLARSENRHGSVYWRCRCKCGRERDLSSRHVQHTRSCVSCAKTTHGLSNDPRYRMMMQAQNRARRAGIAFALKITDIEVPQVCPLLGIPLFWSGQRTCPNNPSLDRIVPALGYVPGNVWVISWKANVIKSDASVDELELLAQNLRLKLGRVAA